MICWCYQVSRQRNQYLNYFEDKRGLANDEEGERAVVKVEEGEKVMEVIRNEYRERK